LLKAQATVKMIEGRWAGGSIVCTPMEGGSLGSIVCTSMDKVYIGWGCMGHATG